MKRALLKTAFHVAVALLTLVMLIPLSLVLDAMFPMRPGPSGHYQGDRLFQGILSISLCLYLADRVVSFAFPGQRPRR